MKDQSSQKRNLKTTRHNGWNNLFTDANPSDTIHVKYKTEQDLLNTIAKLEKEFKTGHKTHKRISQISNLIKNRLGLLRTNGKHEKEYNLADKYSRFLKKRTLKKNMVSRRKLIFHY